MKKGLAIVVALIMLASGMKVSIDHHYCGGQLAGTKISFSGKLASCGMENGEQTYSRQISIKQKCCEDKLACYGIFNSFVPEYFTQSQPLPDNNLTAFPSFSVALNSNDLFLSNVRVLPPGQKLKPGISLSGTYILRV